MGLPERIGRYEIVARLATGGMAEILLGRLRGVEGIEQKPVVIKRILPHLARSKSFVVMFLDEARIAVRIRHPNVVAVHELGLDDGELFLVMEYLEGESVASLARRLVTRSTLLDPLLTAFVLAEACAGLEAAHELTLPDGTKQHLVHRDVSPQNVFVTYQGEVKVLDFGVAKAAGSINSTEAGQLKGKFEYMSPEQCRGEPLDRRSDVFGLGILLYELGTARRLFNRPAQLASLRAITTDPIVPPSRLVASYPRVLERICMRALARDAGERYPTAASMREDLLTAMLELGGTSDAPAAALARRMQELFTERAEEKAEMLQCAREGSVVVKVPPDEPEDCTDVDPGSATKSAPPIPPGRSPPRLRGTLAAAATLVAAVAIAASVAHRAWRSPGLAPVDKPTIAAPAPPEARASALEPASAAVAEPLAPGMVTVHVDTRPEGARVLLSGVDRGATPLDVELARSRTPLSLDIRRKGFAPMSQQIVPDEDRMLLLSLELEHARRAASKPLQPAPPPSATAPPATAPSAGGFRRFQ